MMFLKLVMGFAPWLAFLVIAQGSLLRLEIGLGVALVLSIVMGLAGWQRGIIFWVGLVFFVYAAVAVLAFGDMWTIRHMGVLANGALAIGAWLTLGIGRPFTLDYARQHADPAIWNTPAFIRSNVVITMVWAATFTIDTLLSWGDMEGFALPNWGYQTLSYASLLGAAAFSSWYPARLRRRRLEHAAALQRPTP